MDENWVDGHEADASATDASGAARTPRIPGESVDKTSVSRNAFGDEASVNAIDSRFAS
jgi:hypothetical protein